jgi:hypothetical protein
MSDDDYVEGNESSEPADTPVEDTPKIGQTIDSSSVTDAPVLQKQRATARTASARKAFAEAILATKKEAAAKPPTEADELDPEAPAIPGKPAELDAKKDAVAAKATGGAPIPDPRIATPPAPSLDPEVRKLREQAAAELAQARAERAEFDKQRKAAEPAPVDALSLENYIDSAPKAYRTWLESMRGEKFASDDEFKAEVSDFVTSLSMDVLGVPLPDNIRAAFDAAQAKKIVRTHKTIQTRKEAAAQAKLEQERAAAETKAETERVEHEWGKAATILSQRFASTQDGEGKPQTSAAAKAHPWLAAEDEPGKIIVDVIRAAVMKDGTQLSWEEAAKRANDFLASEAQRYYDKRKPLLASSAPAATQKPPTTAAKPITPPATPPPGDKPPQKWSREKHMENTRAAFRAAVAGDTK